MTAREEIFDVPISAAELAYLKQLFVNDERLADLLEKSEADRGKFNIRLGVADAERLRDRLTEMLATLGFDKDYCLTSQGRMLEDLIDRFYQSSLGD